MHFSDYLPDYDTPVSSWTLEECSAHVAACDEAEGEQRAEYGSGAVSLGYDGSEAMMYYDGFRAADDPSYREARARLDAARSAIVSIPRPPADDDIPF